MLKLEKVNNGDISFSEIGEYFYDYFGDEISRILEELIECFKDEKKKPVTIRVLSKEEEKILFDDLNKRIIEEQGL